MSMPIALQQLRAAPAPFKECDVSPPLTFSFLPSGQENCDRVILVSSPTHLPRCLRDACSLWLDPQHRPPPGGDGATPTAGERPENADTMARGGRDKDGRRGENGGGEKRRRRRQPWLPLVLASPSDTNYAGYGPDDVAIVEPPHRGDRDCGLGDGSTGGSSCGRDPALIPVDPSDSAAGGGKEVKNRALATSDSPEAGEAATPLLLLHDLVGLALRVGKSSDEGFRKELQELLRRYEDVE